MEKFQTGIHHHRIIEDASVLLNLLNRRVNSQCWTIGTVGGDGLHHVGHGQDPCLQENAIPFQILG